MVKNYLKIAIRNIWKNKMVSLTNLLGLTIGVASCLLLLLFVRYEYSFDKFSEETNQIYFHYSEQKGPNFRKVGLTGNGDYDDLVDNYAAISDVAKIRNNLFSVLPDGDETKRVDIDAWFGSSNFFDFFDFPLVDGDAKTVLSDPSSIVLTTETAKKLFGDENPIGKTLTIDEAGIRKDLIVSGLAKPIENSHIEFEAVIPWDMTRNDGAKIADMYFGRSLYTYIKVAPGTDMDVLKAEVNQPLVDENQSDELELLFMPFRQVYLESSDIRFMAFKSGNKQTINTLFAIAVIILLVACINYVNLQTARGAGRSLEVGIRKVMGANRSQLSFQFLGESVLFTLMASLLSVLVIDLALPYFNQLTGKDFTIQFLFSEGLIIILILIALVTALLSGVYPAIVMSSFLPSRALKSSVGNSLKGGGLRKALMLAQFGISIFLVTVTYLTFQQTGYINKKDLGFNRDQVVIIPVTSKNLDDRKAAFKNELATYPGVAEVSISTDVLGDGYTNNSGMMSLVRDPEARARATIFGVDHNFVETYDLEIIDGRSFDIEFSSDSSAMIVNEEFAKQMGLNDPVGKKVEFWRTQYTILGVVKNFNFQALHQKINPAVLRISPRNLWQVSVKIEKEAIPETLALIEEGWKKFEPDMPFQYTFVDQKLERFYRSETKLLKATTFFSFTSIFLTALGIFGMATFIIERKLKEIGIRKVLGATMAQIHVLVIRQFGAVLLLAFLIASPIAYYAGSEWLSEFAYRIDITLVPFLVAFALSAIIIGLTVGAQSTKAARSDLSQILRDE